MQRERSQRHLWSKLTVTYWYDLWYSVPVTIIAGVIWSYDGSLADFMRQLRGAVRAGRT